MSHSFFKFIKIFTSTNKNNFEPLIGLFVIPHFLYVVSTQKDENITITNKYKYVCNGYTYFMIIDNKGAHYNVNNSYWFWKWDSIEDWHKLKIGDNIYAKYYGLRIPFLGCFPNIIDTNYRVKDITKIDNKNHPISIDPVLTTNNDNNRIPREVITSALATFK